MADEKYPEKKYNMPIEAVPLTTNEVKLYQQLSKALSKRDDLAPPTEIQLITHTRRFQHLGKTDEERYTIVLEKMVTMLKLRQKYKLDTILERPWSDKVSFETCCEVWPIFIYNRSHEGLPILYDCLGGSGDMDKATELFMNTPEGQVRLNEYILRIQENFLRVKAKCAEKRNLQTHQLYKGVLVIDLKNVGMFTFNSVRKLLQKGMEETQILYPDTMRRMYLINTSWLFRGIWNVVCLFMDEITQAKIQILGSDYLNKMVADGIPLEHIPEMLGGKCQLKPIFGRDLEFPELSPVPSS